MRGEWTTVKALAIVADAGRLEDVPVLADRFEAVCRPCPPQDLIDRLTALGMSMAPNRPQQEAAMWLHEFKRLLGDIPRDILFGAIDELQKRLKFLPTVAEIREVADPLLQARRQRTSRIDAMRRYLESGQPIPRLAKPEPTPPRNDEPIGPEEAERLNAFLTKAGATTRYKGDGSTFQVPAQKVGPRRIPAGPLRAPTRADYLELGVDPTILDSIEAEKPQAGV